VIHRQLNSPSPIIARPAPEVFGVGRDVGDKIVVIFVLVTKTLVELRAALIKFACSFICATLKVFPNTQGTDGRCHLSN
jgi:hypothetical protein